MVREPEAGAGAVLVPGRAPGSLGRAAAWLSKQVELALADAELSLPQYRILGVLAEGASMPSALAERLAVRRPTITAVVEGLESRGLVERTPDGGDRRSITHTLTARGERLLDKANAAVDVRLTDIAAYLEDPAASERALEGLDLWRSAMRAYGQAKAAQP